MGSAGRAARLRRDYTLATGDGSKPSDAKVPDLRGMAPLAVTVSGRHRDGTVADGGIGRNAVLRAAWGVLRQLDRLTQPVMLSA